MKGTIGLMKPGAVSSGKRDKNTAYLQMQVPNFIMPGGNLRMLTQKQLDIQRQQREARVPDALDGTFINQFIDLAGPEKSQAFYQ